MKLRLEVDENLVENEIFIRCTEMTDEILHLQKQLQEILHTSAQMAVYQGDTEYYLKLSEIIFLETAESTVAVHTKDQIYSTKQRLYELEEILPSSFMRVSKSTILNCTKIRGIKKNITGSSEVEFIGTSKKAFVSRNYIHLLMEKMEEKRLKHE